MVTMDNNIKWVNEISSAIMCDREKSNLINGVTRRKICKNLTVFIITLLLLVNVSCTKVEGSQNFDNVSDRIIFLGDSITHLCKWDQLLPGLNVLDYGILSDPSGGVLSRLDGVIRLKPKKIFIMVGINDIYNGQNSDVMTNYPRIIDNLIRNSHYTKIYIQSILPVTTQKAPKSINFSDNMGNKYIVEDNKELESLVKNINNINVKYIDLYTEFLDANENLSDKYSDDGLHLNKDGCRHWLDLIKGFL
ncbi:MAG: hypothetical protein HQK96_03015 [Nitrospirae bacterium]|nr:hypothetical protein [Nitrospirota bacterium]